VVASLQRMRRTGLLAALLPELIGCMGLVPGDSAHTLTVGEHSLAVLGNIIHLRDAVIPDDARLGPYRAALTALDSPIPLYLAALLHDIGKQWRTLRDGQPAPHEITGAERIPEIGERLGWPPEVIETTRFLVRWHLLLAETSRLRDLGHPETVRETARAVGDGERLRMLYILTYADTTAVGPGVFTDMNARLLEELFLRTEAQLARATEVTPPLDAGMRDDNMASVRERLRRRLAQQRVTPTGAAAPEAIREHIEAMPSAYLLNTPLETMALHLAMVERLYAGESVVLDMRAVAGDAGQTVITVVTRDDPAPGLLAKLTGALFACDVNLHTAQVFTREQPRGEGLVIDTLVVDHKGRSLGVDKRNAVDEAIRLVLRGEKTVSELLAQRRRPLASPQPFRSVRVETTTSGEYTVVDVEAPDEPGVVYRVASLLTGQGWNIHAARVSAWAGNARAAFYITDPAGNTPTPETVSLHLPLTSM
jgi:[protein-PII] uridylyltransferase